jgi:multiple sugar transport system substrate-binding protein
MRSRINALALALSIAASMLLVACGGAAAPAAEPTTAPEAAAATEAPAATEATAAPAADAVTIRYGLWDGNQQPAYEACAAAFTKDNPNITVKVEQAGWGDYWNGVQTGMVSDTAPDVFTNHLAKYPEFASKEQLVDLKPFIDRDGVDTNQYLAGLADLWGRDGKTYGLPKDWDTIAVVYNQDMLDKAGVTVDELNNAEWNAKDGGSFGQIIKKLTLDANGKNALDADFDKTTVVQYGFIPGGSGGAYGQTQWSHWAVSNGFKFNDGLYATKYYYDDPKLAETIQWYANLNLVDGVAPTLADVKSLGANALFTGGKGALTTDGSWMIGAYTKDTKFKTGFARLPKGPEGRKSMFNGLADSIWVGSKHQEESWQWLKFASSPACENIVGSYGVVFPAIQSGVDAALAAYTAKGLDVSAFTAQATEANGTFLFPVTDHASEIGPIMDALMDSIMLGEKTAVDGLKEGNDQVNALFQ